MKHARTFVSVAAVLVAFLAITTGRLALPPIPLSPSSFSAAVGSAQTATGTFTGPDGGTWQSSLNPPGGVGGIDLPQTSNYIIGTPSSGHTWTRISFEGYQVNTATTDNSIYGGFEWENAASTSVGTIISGGSPTAGIMQFSLLGNAGVFNFATGASGSHGFTAAPSFQVASVANATNYLIATPSNGGTPTLSTNAGNLALLPAGGKVGIGTTNPSDRLDIADVARIEGAYPILRFFGNRSSSGERAFQMQYVGGTLYLGGLADDFSAWAPSSILFTHSGKVGVGRNPLTQLDVQGLIRATQTTSAVCSPSVEGAFYYDPSNKHFLGCDGGAWRQLDN